MMISRRVFSRSGKKNLMNLIQKKSKSGNVEDAGKAA